VLSRASAGEYVVKDAADSLVHDGPDLASALAWCRLDMDHGAEIVGDRAGFASGRSDCACSIWVIACTTGLIFGRAGTGAVEWIPGHWEREMAGE
jgi:hypothetical protein